MSLRRHVLRLVVLATAVAVCFSAFAGAASAKKVSAKKKAEIRRSLKKQIKKNPGAIKRKSFLRKAALVNFQLPVTIRLRNQCLQNTNGQNNVPQAGPPAVALTCADQGTALNQRIQPNAKVDLGPSLGSRSISLGGSLAAIVQFNDSYDGGTLGNVNIKILPSTDRTLVTSSVPLLWNEDISSSTTRSDANFGLANSGPGGQLAGLSSWFDAQKQGCGDWTATGQSTARSGNGGLNGALTPANYLDLFYGAPAPLSAGFPTYAGLPGYTVYNTAGTAPNGVFLPVFPGNDNPDRIQNGSVAGSNNYIGPVANPFPVGTAPGGFTGSAKDTVLRTTALNLGIAPAGVAVNMSTGAATTAGGLTTAQGSSDIVTGTSGGQANLFGNIPGRSNSIDVTVSLKTSINAIARIMDQDVFSSPSLVEGQPYPAGIFNCRQIVTGAVQNYIPGVRLTGSLRISPAITKDGKIRIAKATVSTSQPARVALSACLIPTVSANAYNPGNNDATVPTLPGIGAVSASATYPGGAGYGGSGAQLALSNNTALPLNDNPRYPYTDLAGKTHYGPDTTPCNQVDAGVLRASGLTGSVSGLPSVTDSAYGGLQYKGDQVSVAGDITVDPLEVDVLLGDIPNVN